MRFNKSGLAVQVLGTLLLAYGLGSWHSFGSAFVWPSWLALTMGMVGAALIFAVAVAPGSIAVGKTDLDGVSQLMVGLCMALVLLMGFAARADLATYDPIGNIIRWAIVTVMYIIAMLCSYGAINTKRSTMYGGARV